MCYSYRKCPWVTPLKDKKGITITNAFQNSHKTNKIWVGKDKHSIKINIFAKRYTVN